MEAVVFVSGAVLGGVIVAYAIILYIETKIGKPQ